MAFSIPPRILTITFIIGFVVIVGSLAGVLYIGLRVLKNDPYDKDDKDEKFQVYYALLIVGLIIGFGLAVASLIFMARQSNTVASVTS